MKPNQIFFKKSKILPIDKFFRNVLYDKKFGYYTSQIPFGKSGDFITSPKISSIFSRLHNMFGAHLGVGNFERI